MTAPLPVLFTHYGGEWIRGSETVLLDLLRFLDKGRVRPVVWCNGADMAEAARAAGYPTYRSPFSFFLDYSSPRLDPAVFRRLMLEGKELCKKHGIRVLHANSAGPTQWLVPVGMSRRIPVLTHLHIDYLRRSRYALLLHAATLVVGVSRQVIDGLLADGMDPSRTRVIYNGIDFSRVGRSQTDLRAALGIPPEAFVVATAGSLIPRKSHDVLLRAFHSLAREPTPPHLLIAGDGPERAALQALAASLDLADRAHFLGHITDMAQVYQAADVFALATRKDSFGLVIVEAGYFGLPAVSTRVGGVPEVVVEGETGLLVPPDDAAAFSRALLRLREDRALRARLGTAAATRAVAMFGAERMAREFEETYERLAALPASQLGWRSLTRRLGPYARLMAPPRWTKPQSRYTC